jgi:hypothetical protein
MSSSALRVLLDTACPSEALRHLAKLSVPAVIMHRLYRDLVRELGTDELAVCSLIDLATESGKPIALNVSTGEDTSTTVLLSPRGWGEERVRGWAGGLSEGLEAMFGPASPRRIR